MENTETRVRATLHNIFWALEIRIQPTEYNTVLADMGVDSVDFVELIMETELEFHISISNNEMDRTSTFNDLLQLVTTKVTGNRQPITSNQQPL